MQLEVCSTVQFGSAKAFTAQCREDGAQAFHKNSGTSTQILSQLASSDFLPHESVPEIYLGSAQGLFEGKKRHTDSPHVWWIKTYEKRVLWVLLLIASAVSKIPTFLVYHTPPKKKRNQRTQQSPGDSRTSTSSPLATVATFGAGRIPGCFPLALALRRARRMAAARLALSSSARSTTSLAFLPWQRKFGDFGPVKHRGIHSKCWKHGSSPGKNLI